ncbi:MAG: radical SAM protein [Planctomycetes bacterium]|nr:radical SAM protein [Planctomycetota bacterium]
MRYEGKIYRPPSEANSFILQATIGCSWNACTYCDMYNDKKFRLRETADIIADIELAGQMYGDDLDKVFVADGDALTMPMAQWLPVLNKLNATFPRLRRISAYAMASNLIEKTAAELSQLRELGLTQLYIGPESGDDKTLHSIAKGGTFAEHVEAASKAHKAGIKLSCIFLLGAGGVARSEEHALASAKLCSEMDPRFVSLLTLTVVPGTPQDRLQQTGRFELPDMTGLLNEIKTFVQHAKPSDAIFRTNHASNYLPLAGRLPRDRQKIIEIIEAALDGKIPMRPEWSRGL